MTALSCRLGNSGRVGCYPASNCAKTHDANDRHVSRAFEFRFEFRSEFPRDRKPKRCFENGAGPNRGSDRPNRGVGLAVVRPSQLGPILTQRDTNSPYPGTSLGTILGKTIDVLGTHRVGRKLSHLIRKFCPKETGTHRETESLPKFWEGARGSPDGDLEHRKSRTCRLKCPISCLCCSSGKKISIN